MEVRLVAPTYHKDRNGFAVCDGCGCELGSHAPGDPGKYPGHTDDCPFMKGRIVRQKDVKTREDAEAYLAEASQPPVESENPSPTTEDGWATEAREWAQGFIAGWDAASAQRGEMLGQHHEMDKGCFHDPACPPTEQPDREEQRLTMGQTRAAEGRGYERGATLAGGDHEKGACPMTLNKRGEWVPAIPPSYDNGAVFRWKCHCGKRFWTTEGYRAHYALRHIIDPPPPR